MAVARKKTNHLKVVPNEYFAPEYAACRTMSHEWEPLEVLNNKRYREYVVTHVCKRCTTLKRFAMSYSGIIVKRMGYTYPDGYLAGHRLSDNEKGAMGLEYLTQIEKVIHKGKPSVIEKVEFTDD